MELCHGIIDLSRGHRSLKPKNEDSNYLSTNKLSLHHERQGIWKVLAIDSQGRSVERRLASLLARRIMAGERSAGSRRTLMT